MLWASWVFGELLHKRVVWCEGSIAAETCPLWSPFLQLLLEVGRPMHMSLREFPPCLICAFAGGVNKKDSMAAKWQHVGRWSWGLLGLIWWNGCRLCVASWVWDQHIVLLA